MIQGRSQIQQWVTKFKVQYGDDVNSLKYISVGSKPLVSVSLIISKYKIDNVFVHLLLLIFRFHQKQFF